MAAIPEECTVIVIGAGPAGLAVGACLKQAGIPSILLEQNQTVGSAWYRHYDRLHLHTDKRNSVLPFRSFPKEVPRYPSRLQVIEYLESYARTFQLDIRFGQQVVLASKVNDKWEVRTQDSIYRAPSVVFATGYNCEPLLPVWRGRDQYKGPVLHSSSYKNGGAFRGQRVLVIGFGNSGGEIAIDLWEHGAQPAIAVRSPVNVIPRELFGIPILSISILQTKMPMRVADAINAPLLRLAVGDLTRYGLRKLPYGPATQVRRDGHVPLIDVGTVQLIKQGHVVVCPGVEEFNDEGVKFTDGQQAKFDAVILATGYRPRVNSFLHAPGLYNQEGMPLTTGTESSMAGLYFCGFYVSPAGMLREIAIEAKQIGKQIETATKRAKVQAKESDGQLKRIG